ncbi:MAG: hypothetical protein JJU02_10115 [Cryomorphaceae bacterium]|nr:hypothetical protein [Cryomorphaceae bacterium]
MRISIYSLLILLIFSACSGSNRFYKYGVALTEAGLHREAAERYMESLRRNPNNVKAQIALRQDGQKVLDGHLQDFYLAHTEGNHSRAVQSYEAATRYRDLVMRSGVNLTFPDNYRPMFLQSENHYLQNLYQQAHELIDDQRYAEAENILKEITRLRNDYEDALELKNLAFVEPRYQEGLEAFRNERFRQAYYLFSEVENRVANYKDTRNYRQMAKERGIFTIGVLPFENRSKVRNIDGMIMARLMAEVNNIDDPFLRLIDRTNTDKIIAEQRLSLEGVIDQNTAVIAGEMLGAKALLKCVILDAREVEGELKVENRKGFLGTPVRVKDPKTDAVTTQMQYSKVLYQHFTKENEVAITLQYQLVSTASGEILHTDVIELRRNDRADYARYEGDHRYLYAGTWESPRRASPKDRMYNSARAKRELNNSLQASDEVENVSNLRSQLVRDISARIARQLQNFNPER